MSVEPIEIRSANYRPSEPVTWVGEGRHRDEICLGFESGKVQLFDSHFKPTSNPSPILGFGEAINGAAFFDNLCAVSSRGEVSVNIWTNDNNFTKLDLAGGGSHGVIVSKERLLVAPMGSDGLLLMRFNNDGQVWQATHTLEGKNNYFYQTVLLDKDHQNFEWFASAGRTDGLHLTSIDPDLRVGQSLTFAPLKSSRNFGLDIVSLCSLDLPGYPFALAHLGMDNSIHLSQDARNGFFWSMASKEIRGTPYSIHNAKGHLIILTSEKIYIVQNAASDALQDVQTKSNKLFHRIISFVVDAVDCSIFNDEYLLIIHEDRVSLTLISELFNPSDGNRSGSHGLGGWAENGYITSEFQPALDSCYEFNSYIIGNV